MAAPLLRLFHASGPLTRPHRETLDAFFMFAFVGKVFRTWLARVVGMPLSGQVACEIVRYQAGDFSAEHSDTADGRVMGVNFYLGRDRDANTGGQLQYRDDEGQVHTLSPSFNSVSLIPIRAGCVHWVSPWRSEAPGRYNIPIAYNPEPVSGQPA